MGDAMGDAKKPGKKALLPQPPRFAHRAGGFFRTVAPYGYIIGYSRERHIHTTDIEPNLCPSGAVCLPSRPDHALRRQELELELIQPHMTQKPVLRGEVDARALRV